MSHACVLVAIPAEGDVKSLVAAQMAPFDENGKRWFAEGTRWDYWIIGGRYAEVLSGGKTIVRRSDLNREQEEAYRRNEALDDWEASQKEKDKEWLFGILPGETQETFIARRSHFATYAFLARGTWHESERLGFFAGSAATECEASNPEHTGKCLFEKDGARLLSWNEPKEVWAQKYWDRFIENLDPSTRLVVVDYHV